MKGQVYFETTTGPLAMLHVQVVRTPAEIAQGLAGRRYALLPDEGMLFDLGHARRIPARFTTVGMYFPLDFALVAEPDRGVGREVVHIVSAVPPGIAEVVTVPPGKVRWIVEAPAGWLYRNHVQVGSVVLFLPTYL